MRLAGVRTSKRRVLRLMRDNDLLAPSRVGSPRGPRSHDGTIIPKTVDTMWGTDLTTTITGEGLAAVFVAVDHCSVECVGVHAAARATRFEALEPIRQGVREHFGSFTKNIACGLSVRHDHGSQYMSDAFQKELGFLGAESSPRLRPRARRKWLRRTVHPHAEGEPVVGADLRYDRGSPTGVARLSANLQYDLADRATRIRHARSVSAKPASTGGARRVGFNSVSQQPWAVQSG